jgi:hypothetical protein
MYKYIFRARVGSWWLTLGFWRKASPFSYGSMEFLGIQDYWLRIFWLEVGMHKPPS